MINKIRNLLSQETTPYVRYLLIKNLTFIPFLIILIFVFGLLILINIIYPLYQFDSILFENLKVIYKEEAKDDRYRIKDLHNTIYKNFSCQKGYGKFMIYLCDGKKDIINIKIYNFESFNLYDNLSINEIFKKNKNINRFFYKDYREIIHRFRNINFNFKIYETSLGVYSKYTIIYEQGKIENSIGIFYIDNTGEVYLIKIYTKEKINLYDLRKIMELIE
jgi:hypothetical protein